MAWTITYHNRTSKPLNLSVFDANEVDWPFRAVHIPKLVLDPGGTSDYLEIDLSGPEIYPDISWDQAAWVSDNPFLYVRINLNITSPDTWNWVVTPFGDSTGPTDWGPDYTSESSSTVVSGQAGKQKVDFSSINHGSALAIDLVFHDA